jgi:hypothetical protein
MKRVYELDVYKLAEELSDMVWQDFDRWNKKFQTCPPSRAQARRAGQQINR